MSPSALALVKLFATAGVIAAVSEIAKRSPALAALVASLPMISVLGMCWMAGEGLGPRRIADHAEATFFYVLPSLPMFLLMPWLLRRGVGFPLSLAAGVLLTALLYLLTVTVVGRFGLRL